MSRSPYLAVIALSLAFLAAPRPATLAQGGDLDAIRQNFAKRTASASISEFERYHAELSKLENQLVEQRDYASAIHVQRERLRVSATLESLTSNTSGRTTPPSGDSPATPENTPLSLLLPSASTGGGVTLDTSGLALDGWDTAGAYAEWSLPATHAPGGYQIELTYTTRSSEGGSYEISESFYTLTRKTSPATDPPAEITTTEGILRMNPGPGKLRITAKQIPADAPLFTLKSVRLIPLKP